ncbi:HAD superfamily hydrolase (TIGR01509 family) [Arthrobacter silviterrae]|uniref:HAD-IA family hydrolase n=1 Tax=Arthrobacter silviterrae TaxID=2026658 RepID=UPI00196B04D8|nr:HAD-IA family hydrolase [Arthrobacter silviterrae]MDQ0278627.1 HAD superfamily hydrolase (TIGR01509 family) [Arthrobacter silviterrae]
MAKKSKKSRFGNPARAAADAAARANSVPLREVRLDRAMEALAPGYALWLESQGRPDADIDMSLMVLDDFFDLYRMLEPTTDALSLVPGAVREVLAAAAAANPQATFALRSGVRDYVGYLVQASLWTGTPGELAELADVFKQPAWPGVDPASPASLALPPEGAADHDVDLDDGWDDDGWDDGGGAVDPADYAFADVFVPEQAAGQFASTARESPLWKNVESILAWVGGGRDVTTKGVLRKKDRAQAAVAIRHSGAGLLGAAVSSSYTAAELEAEALDRLALYWHLLTSLGLVAIEAGRAVVGPRLGERLGDEAATLEVFRDVLGQFIFVSTLSGSEPGRYTSWHVDMASFMAECSSENPPESAPLVQALESPDTAHPELYILARNVASWAAEGLVTVDSHVTVPPAFRREVADMLAEDFHIKAVGPGAKKQPQQVTVDAVLFDLDGTLIDSTPATERAWRRWGELMGLDGFEYGSHGVPAQAQVEQYLEPARQEEGFELIKALETADTDGILCKPGAAELLASLPDGSWTIVTSCTRGLAEARLAAAGIAVPAHMVTADQVANGKPHPEPFLLGAARLGSDIAQCLVVEDAPAGLASGTAAGAMTLAVAGTTDAADLTAHYVVDSLAGVAAAVLPNGQIQLTLP